MKVYSRNGSMKLGKKIADGGEGIVYALSNNSVAKIYKQSPTAETEKKLKQLSQLNAIADTAWPNELIYSDSAKKNLIGYIMPRITGRTWNNFNMASSRLSPDLSSYKQNSNFFYEMCVSLISVVRDIHASPGKLIIGDVNDSNILVNTKGGATIIDVDSFQVNNSLLCTVSRSEFLAPDLQGKSLSSTVRSKKHDQFAMAVVIYQLLFNGVHPFSGKGGVGATSPGERIKLGLCLADKAYIPPPHQNDINLLSQQLKHLFIKAFTLKPLSCNDWLKAFSDDEKQIKKFIVGSLKLNQNQKKRNNLYGFNASNRTTGHASSAANTAKQNQQARVRPQKKTPRKQRSWMKYAASVVLCLSIVAGIKNYNADKSTEPHPIQQIAETTYEYDQTEYEPDHSESNISFTERNRQIFSIESDNRTNNGGNYIVNTRESYSEEENESSAAQYTSYTEESRKIFKR